MNDEQLKLMARIVVGLTQLADIYSPYHVWLGTPIGQCRYCGVVGEIQRSGVVYDHKPECIVMLAQQLYASLGTTGQEKQE